MMDEDVLLAGGLAICQRRTGEQCEKGYLSYLEGKEFS
jgi:hypothetical protein